MKSIKSAILINFMIVIVLIVLILGGLFSGIVWKYYYGSSVGALTERSMSSVTYFNEYLVARSLHEKARALLDRTTAEDESLIEIIDLKGKLVMDSNGFTSDMSIHTPDVEQALTGETGVWFGKDPVTKERIVAISNPLQEQGRVLGVLRHTSSLASIDRMVRNIMLSAAGIAALVILFSLALSLLLSRRIIGPVRELTLVAKQLAGGNYQMQAVKHNEDEIGHLADTFNYMAEEIQKNDRLKSEFISSVSHELRTPLTSIKGWSETLADSDWNELDELKVGLKVISKETDRLIGLVEELLDFSKLQSGAMTIRKERIQLNSLVEEVHKQYTTVLGSRSLVVNKESQLPEISADANRIRQVLINLLDNASKFTAEDGHIVVSTSLQDETVQVSVRDDGEGIPPEALNYVMDKFYKGNTNKRGSGLGLSVCKEIMLLHGGRMEINSELGYGTEVHLYFPR